MPRRIGLRARWSSFRWSRFLSALLFLVPACVVRLSDRNSALENGGVSGPAADCKVVVPVGEGAPSTDPSAAKTKYVGRYDFSDPTRPTFDWSGNYMNARFRGTEVSWGADSGIEIVFEQIIDGKVERVIRGGPDPDLSKPLTIKLPEGEHEITVVRSSEALFSVGAFIPFAFPPGTVQLPPIERPRRIEYIGDSITCGYGDLGPNATCPYDVPFRGRKIPESQNIYVAYGSIAARRLAADAVTLCFSGKGVVLNYREQGVGEGKLLNPSDLPDPDAKTTIPEYYLRTLASVSENLTCVANGDCGSNVCIEGLCRCTSSDQCCADKNIAKCDARGNKCAPPPAGAPGTGNTCRNKPNVWDFAKDQPQPQVVLINIGTNDFARDVRQRGIADGLDENAFRAGYKKFVDFVRTKRPDAHIFLAVPPMVTDKFPLDNARTDFTNILRSIADELNHAGDGKVYSMELVEMGVRYGLGCDYHPNLEVHRIMADQVVGAIRSKTCWSTVDTQ